MKMRGKKKDPGWKLWNAESCRCWAFSINLPVENTDLQVSEMCMCVEMESKRVTESPGKLDLLWHCNEFWVAGGVQQRMTKELKTNSVTQIPLAKQDVANVSFLAVVPPKKKKKGRGQGRGASFLES